MFVPLPQNNDKAAYPGTTVCLITILEPFVSPWGKVEHTDLFSIKWKHKKDLEIGFFKDFDIPTCKEYTKSSYINNTECVCSGCSKGGSHCELELGYICLMSN